MDQVIVDVEPAGTWIRLSLMLSQQGLFSDCGVLLRRRLIEMRYRG
jgi:hypothetical protein